jgi:hypothetical protein
VRVGRETISLIERQGAATIRLYAVPDTVIVAETLELAGIQSAPSDAGALATRAIEALGGEVGADALRGLQHPAVRRFITNREARRGLTSTQANTALRQAIDRTAQEPKPSFKIPQAPDLFHSLVGQGLFRVSLSVPCVECRTRSLLEPEALAAETQCPRCGARFALASAAFKSHWTYRITSFLDQPGQDGLLPVFLTMIFLQAPVRLSEVTVVAGLDLCF